MLFKLRRKILIKKYEGGLRVKLSLIRALDEMRYGHSSGSLLLMLISGLLKLPAGGNFTYR